MSNNKIELIACDARKSSFQAFAKKATVYNIAYSGIAALILACQSCSHRPPHYEPVLSKEVKKDFLVSFYNLKSTEESFAFECFIYPDGSFEYTIGTLYGAEKVEGDLSPAQLSRITQQVDSYWSRGYSGKVPVDGRLILGETSRQIVILKGGEFRTMEIGYIGPAVHWPNYRERILHTLVLWEVLRDIIDYHLVIDMRFIDREQIELIRNYLETK